MYIYKLQLIVHFIDLRIKQKFSKTKKKREVEEKKDNE